MVRSLSCNDLIATGWAFGFHRARTLSPFGAKPLDRIGEAGIRRWFDRYSWTAPSNANLALARLRQILSFAAACGHVEANPGASEETAVPRSRGSCPVRRSPGCMPSWTRRPGKAAGGRPTSSAFCCSPAAAGERSRVSDGPRSGATCWRLATARRGRGRSRSAPAPAPFSNGSLGEKVRSCFLRRAAPSVRAVPNSACGTGFAVRLASKTSAFTTSVIRWRAMP